jgi:hypothetical protein
MHDDIVSLIALTMGLGWAAGINLYAALFMLGFMGATGHIELPAGLQVLSDPLVLCAAAFMYCVEFFADKVPGVDSAWDAIHTFVRIPAGAVLASQAVGDVSLAAQIAAALLGGALAMGAHLSKAGTRMVLNASPEPVSNWTASVGEDLAVLTAIWMLPSHPYAVLALLTAFVIAALLILPKLWHIVSRKVSGWHRDIGPQSRPIVAREPRLPERLGGGA